MHLALYGWRPPSGGGDDGSSSVWDDNRRCLLLPAMYYMPCREHEDRPSH